MSVVRFPAKVKTTSSIVVALALVSVLALIFWYEAKAVGRPKIPLYPNASQAKMLSNQPTPTSQGAGLMGANVFPETTLTFFTSDEPSVIYQYYNDVLGGNGWRQDECVFSTYHWRGGDYFLTIDVEPVAGVGNVTVDLYKGFFIGGCVDYGP